MQLQLKLVDEPWPSQRWQRFFTSVWPAYRAWFESEGDAGRPDLVTCQSLLELHMPELVPVYRSLCRLTGNDDRASRFLSMWCPPRYLAGCSQIAWTRGNPTLVRNYDYSPKYFDGRLRLTDYRKPVLGVQDSGWGLLDGMNADGLAAALAFGGRQVTGAGFGIPLLIRYVLETCSTVDEACHALCRLPVHMAYSVTLIDRTKRFATVHLGPDRPAEVVDQASVTNHQRQVEWDEHAAFTHTRERKEILDMYLADKSVTRKDLLTRFLKPPLYSQQYLRGFGTLYTAAYDVVRGVVTLVWPSQQVATSFNTFTEQVVDVVLLRPAGRVLVKGGADIRHIR